MPRQIPSSSLIGASAARYAMAASLLALAACGGSDSNPALTLSGTVSGLSSAGLTLASNGISLPISAGATTFTFGPVLSDEVGYSVIVGIQPSGQACTVANGSGVASTANISNVVVTCSDRTFNIGGTISGLTASGLVLANGSDTLDVPVGAASFTMPAPVAYGSSYAVTVAAQPAGLTCNVTGGSGTMSTVAVTSITVKCAAPSPTVSGSISGLDGATGLVLADDSEAVAVAANAKSFRLDTPRAPGGAYAVRVQSQPAGLTCSPGNASGTMPTHDVTDVSITCSDQAYRLGGTVDGLSSAGLVLGNGSESYAVPAGATYFSLPTAVAYGGSYAVTVQAQPAGLTCTVSDGAGTMPAGPVSSVDVTCASTRYTLGGSISGLTGSGLVLTDGTDDLSVSANALRFSMPHSLAYGSRYAVTIRAQPDGGSCRITRPTGTVEGDVDTVQVACGGSAPQP